MNVGAQRPTKIPKRSPAAPASPASVPPCVNQTTMLPITDKNPSAYERFALNPSDFSFLNIFVPFFEGLNSTEIAERQKINTNTCSVNSRDHRTP